MQPRTCMPPVSGPGSVIWNVGCLFFASAFDEALVGALSRAQFFYAAGYGTPNFDRMAGNPVARQIPWDADPELLAAWAQACACPSSRSVPEPSQAPPAFL